MDFKVNTCTEKELKDFLDNNAFQFGYGYKEMCVSTDYYSKLYSNAEKFELWEGKNIIGLLCLYVNREYHYTYIPYLCISLNYKGKGLASKIFQKVFELYYGSFEYIGLEVRIDNVPAKHLYRKFGFTEYGRNGDKIQMRRYLNSKK